MRNSMQTVFGGNGSFFKGLVLGVVVASAVGVMMGQRGARDEVMYDFFVTPGDDTGSTARLWRRPQDRETLEFVGQFASTQRGR